VTIELVPLCTISAVLERPLDIGKTPAGTRMIYEVVSARVDGERLSGEVKGKANADWVTISPDGIATIDVRSTLETDDGELVFVQYLGRTDVSNGSGEPIYIAPRFETGAERYRWLNKVQAVGKGFFDGRTLNYEVYEVA
jgi:hypothetical protein